MSDNPIEDQQRKYSGLSDEALLARAHRLSVESIVTELEDGNYISSGNLSYLVGLSKSSNLRPIKEEDDGLHGSAMAKKLKSLISNADKLIKSGRIKDV